MATQSGDVVWFGDRVSDVVKDAAARGLLLAGEHILGVANELVPLDEATLQRSGAAVVDRDKLTATVAYDTPYAVRQHEELGYRHAPGRQAKYLEQPLHTEANVAQALIAAQVRRATRS